MTARLEVLNEYIQKCDQAILENDKKKAFELQEDILGFYPSEIKNLWHGIDYYAGMSDYHEQNLLRDIIGNIKKLRNRLVIYKDELPSEKNNSRDNSDPKTTNNFFLTQMQNNQNTAINDVSIVFEQTVEQINSIDSLTSDEKEVLLGKLSILESDRKCNADQKTMWEKAKKILIWIADKSVDVGIACLPYIIRSLATLPQ